MTLEATLESIDTTLKALLTAVQSGAQMAASELAGADAAAGTSKRRTKAQIAADEAAAAAKTGPVVDGDPAGTLYFVNDADKVVFAKLPDAAAPESANFKAATAAEYSAKKGEFLKAKEAELSASASAIAAANQGLTAGAAGEVTWDQAVAALKSVAADPAHGGTAVMTLIKQIDPTAANVPALKPLGKNAEIVAAVNALLKPAAAAGAEVDPLFG